MAVDIKVPNVGESVQEGMIAAWHKKDGEEVALDEVLLDLETDKATVEVVAEQAGVLKILVPAGQVVKVGQKIGTLSDAGAKSPKKSEEKSPSPPGSAPQAGPPVAAAPSPASQPSKSPTPGSDAPQPKPDPGPAARRLLQEHGLSSEEISVSGKGGRPTKGDILTHLEKAPEEIFRVEAGSEGGAPKPSEPAQRGIRREPMSMLRRKIAERLVASQHTAATLTTFNEVDMSAILALRKKYQDGFQEKYGIKLGFMGFFLKACVAALQEYPRVNASIDGNDIVYHDYCDIGVAVSTDRGLMVPVVRNVEQLSFAAVELEIANLAKKGRENKITLEDLSGGTFTVSNGGVFGSLLSTPILNPPQTGILGMHKTELRPVVTEDRTIVVRPMMYVALSYDHRMIDGKESVGFLVAVKNALEDPSRLLLGV